MAVQVKYVNKIPKYRQEIYDDLANLVSETAHAIEGTAKILAPKDTGHLANTIKAHPTAHRLTWEVRVGAEYGWIVEKGSRAHVIRAKDGGMLRFIIGGKVIFVKQVNHPGTAPNPFLLPAAHRHTPTFFRGIDVILGFHR